MAAPAKAQSANVDRLRPRKLTPYPGHMRRFAIAVGVAVVDAALLVGAGSGRVPSWVVLAYGLIVAVVVGLGFRSPAVALVVALVVAGVSQLGFVVLLWTAFQAGRRVRSRAAAAVVIGASLGALATSVAVRAGGARAASHLVATFVVFVALPLLVGRYLTQHERLLSALDQQNRELRWRQELRTEQARLRERLAIARDMHDSLGHRLGLVSIQAAALEVSALPAEHRRAVGRLADSTRSALTELHDLVAALRTDRPMRAPGLAALDALVASFRAAGAAIRVERQGEERALTPAVSHTAYRVVEEGLTNATRHAPGEAVTLDITWESDSLIVGVSNALPPDAAAGRAGGGHGLSGLAERVAAVGGVLAHGAETGTFRLCVLLPELSPASAADPADGRLARPVAIGLLTAALMFVALPAGMIVGVR